MKRDAKVVKKVSVRQKRVMISDIVIQGWANFCDVIVEKHKVSMRRVYRKLAQDLDVDILTIKNAFDLNLATPDNIDRITKSLERWKARK